MDEIRIPFHYREGSYPQNALPTESDHFLTLRLEPCDILSYTVPGKGTTVRLYDLKKQAVLENLTATYRDTGELYCVELRKGEDVTLVYLHYLDENDARAEVLDFAEQSAAQIADALLQCHEKVFRLFIEYFYDGESFDYAAKIATEADRQTLLANVSERAKKRMNDPKFVQMLLNNSGDYPYENRVPCDTYTIGIMLQCAPCDLFGFVIQEMTERIKAQVVPQLNKSDDFRLIVSEYD
ncbi:MAG: hypothetical protein K5695_16380 [Oscillospiraceae bacterium]|nr:hypothetical protein [Oscillospiraceae bacterium]